MNIKVLDFRKCQSFQDMHDVICDGLNLPTWYGKNLDALWDMITGYIELPITIYVWKPVANIKLLLKEMDDIMTIFNRAIEQGYELTIADGMNM